MDALELCVVLLFVAVVVHKDAVSGVQATWVAALNRVLNIALVPLGLATVTIIGSRVFTFLS